MAKIRNNFIYNTAITLSSYLINIFLFPYVARVLGVDIVGRIGFVNNVIAYFSLFALLGIPTLGIREISACGDDREKRSEVFSNIIILISIATGIVLVFYLLAVWYIDRLYNEKELFLIGTFSFLSTSFLLEWFYQGVEDFRFIAVRTIIIKIAYAVSVFLFIKSPDDFLLYFSITIFSYVVNVFINVFYARRFVHLTFKNINLRYYIEPFFSLGMYKVILSMYITFNVVYIGFMCSDSEVGYYYTATKFLTIATGLLTAFTNVMLPRMSSLLSEGKQEEFRAYIRKSFDMVFCMAIPLVIGTITLAPQIIKLFAGSGYEGAITPMRIVMLNVLSVGIAQIYAIQVLIPLKYDKIIMISSCFGAIVGITSNILIVGLMGAVGSAIVLIISELSGDMYNYIFATKNKLITFPTQRFFKYIFLSIPYVLVCMFSTILFNNDWLISTSAIVGCGIYFILLHKFIITDSAASIYLRDAENRYIHRKNI